MLTPLLSNWTLDYNRVKKLIDHLIDGGVIKCYFSYHHHFEVSFEEVET
jgi:hypothetical protein